MTDQLPALEAVIECRCADVKNRSAIVNVVFAGKTVLFAPNSVVVLIAKKNWKSI